MTELLAQLGNINATYAAYKHYASLIYVDKNNANIARSYLKLYFKRMLNKASRIDSDKLSHESFLPSHTGFE